MSGIRFISKNMDGENDNKFEEAGIEVPAGFDHKEFARELEFHIRLITSRFEDKLKVIARRMLKGLPEESIESLVENSLAHFGMTIMIVPQNLTEAAARLEAEKKEWANNGITEALSVSLANFPSIIQYPFHFSGECIPVNILKCIDRMDQYIFQFFEHAKLDTTEFTEDLAEKDPRYIPRTIMYTSEFTRDYIVNSLLTM